MHLKSVSLKVSKETSKTEQKTTEQYKILKKCGTITKGGTTHVHRILGTVRDEGKQKISQVIMAEISPN